MNGKNCSDYGFEPKKIAALTAFSRKNSGFKSVEREKNEFKGVGTEKRRR